MQDAGGSLAGGQAVYLVLVFGFFNSVLDLFIDLFFFILFVTFD